MKKLIIFSLILGSVSCSDDLLDTVPLTENVEENFYKSPDDAFEGLVATYDMLQRTGFGHFILTSEMASDNCFGGGGNNDDFSMQSWDQFRPDYFDLNADLWANNYRGIFRANKLISKLDQVTWGDNEALRMRYEAEARFLRAHYYFELARVFGHIPLIVRPLKTDEINQPQVEPEVIYSQIAEDLVFAIENLADIPYGGMPQEQFGRVTKWAAEAMLGRVFLFYSDYYETNSIGTVVTKDEVITYMEDAITNSGHDLVGDYASLWRAPAAAEGLTYVGERNPEVVWSVKYVLESPINWDRNEGNRWQVMIGLRTQRIAPYGFGWGFATVNPDYWDAFDPNDSRRSSTIISEAAEGITFDRSDWRQATGFHWKKYLPISNDGSLNEAEEQGGDLQIDNFEDYIVLRYSDVLLTAAELNLGSNDARAQQYFNRVRERAFGSPAFNLPATRANIIAERRFEFGLEGHRYWDLIRQDMQTAKSALDNDAPGEEFDVSFRTETGGFLEIPETQISLSNGSLEQNDGWN